MFAGLGEVFGGFALFGGEFLGRGKLVAERLDQRALVVSR